MNTITNKILRRIRAKKRGWVFTPQDFADVAKPGTVDQVLFRLAHKNIIRHLSKGIYDFPRQHPKFGTLPPNPDNIIQAIMLKTGDVIFPSPANLVNQLGIDTQVPGKMVYLTSGKSKKLHIANFDLTLKHSKFVARDPKQKFANMVITILHYLGKSHIDNNVIKKCKLLLNNKDIDRLGNLTPTLPRWMVPSINKITGHQYA